MKIAEWNRNTQRTVEYDRAGYEEPILTQIMTYLLQFASQLFLVILFKSLQQYPDDHEKENKNIFLVPILTKEY